MCSYYISSHELAPAVNRENWYRFSEENFTVLIPTIALGGCPSIRARFRHQIISGIPSPPPPHPSCANVRWKLCPFGRIISSTRSSDWSELSHVLSRLGWMQFPRFELFSRSGGQWIAFVGGRVCPIPRVRGVLEQKEHPHESRFDCLTLGFAVGKLHQLLQHRTNHVGGSLCLGVCAVNNWVAGNH